MTRSLDFSWVLYPRHSCGEWNTSERRGEEVSTSLSMPDTGAEESSLQHDERREEEVTRELQGEMGVGIYVQLCSSNLVSPLSLS